MNYKNINNCKRCKKQINFILRHMMPDELMTFNCENCGFRHTIKCLIQETTKELNQLRLEISRYDEKTATTTILLFNDNTNKWEVQE